MNVLLWIVQIALAFLSFAGGAFKVFAFKVDPNIPATAAHDMIPSAIQDEVPECTPLQ